jgi:hypothetical protein
MKRAGFIKKCLPGSFAGRIILLVSVTTVIAILLFLGSIRNIALEKGLDRLALKFASAGYRLTWKDSHFIHYNQVSVSKLLLVSEKDSSRFAIDSLAMKFGVFHALRGILSVKTLTCQTVSMMVDLDKTLQDTITTFTAGGPVNIPSVSNYSLMANRIVHRLFMAVPRRLDIDTIKIVIRKAENDQLLTFLKSTIIRGTVHSSFYTGEESDTTAILLDGRINHKKLDADLVAHNPLRERCVLSFSGKHPVRAGFDSLRISLSFLHYSNKLVTIRITSVSQGLTLEGQAL